MTTPKKPLRSFSSRRSGLHPTSFVGTDVNPIAAHLTASSLAAIGDGERYGDTRVGWLDVGGAEGRTGSLEYFGRAEARDLFTTYGGRATGNVSAGETTVQVQDRTLRWILMNPPYSRTRGGQSAFDIAGLSDRERTRCQKKWRTLVTGEPVNNQAGMAASFLALAARKIVPGGRIGFVLPLTAAFADSWAPTRQMIEREFRNIVAVAVAAGQALGREALSADTGMEEMLLVATKRRETVVRPYSKAAPAEPIRCVTLRQPLSRLGEAGEIGRAITETIDRVGDVGSWQPIRAGDDELGSALVFDAGAEGGPWGPLGVTHADLALAADALTKGRIDYLCDEPLALPVPMSTIGEMFKVGPTHHLIGHMSGKTPIGAFEFHPTVHRQPEGDARQWDAENLDHILGGADAIGRNRSLWNADSQRQTQLLVGPTHKGVSPAGVGSPGTRKAMRAQRSDLLYARAMRWTSQALLAATTVDPLMGGRAWTTLTHPDRRVRRATALWVNSILGMVVHWTRGQRTHAGRSTTQVGAIKQIPIPRLDLLGDSALDRGAAFFEAIRTARLAPACQTHCDPVRASIDEAVVALFGLPPGAIAFAGRLRRLWCEEPSVHGWNQRAVALLEQAGAPEKQPN